MSPGSLVKDDTVSVIESYGMDSNQTENKIDPRIEESMFCAVCAFPRFLVLIFENQHQRALLSHLSSETVSPAPAGRSRKVVIVDLCKKPSELPAISQDR
jgi:hypothetical protein